MPLQIKAAFKVPKGGSGIVFKDVTGPYSASNTGGYGTPNALFSGVTSSNVVITTPSGGSYTINTLASDVYLETVIPNTLLGYSSSEPVEDGIYSAVFTVVTSTEGTKTYTTKFFVTWNVECCLEKAQVEESVLSNSTCTCGCNNRSKTADYFYMIWSANKAFYCGKLETAKAILAYLKTVCQTLNCTTC
jgi:hypothetical protein